MRELCSPINEEFNRIHKESESIFADYAASCGVSSTVVCLLYSLYTARLPCTQSQLAADWAIPRQTVNSCLKTLAAEGTVTLEFVQGNRKAKQIRLTSRGEELAHRIIAPLIRAENAALQALTQEELQFYIQISRKQNAIMRRLLSTDRPEKED